MYKITYKINVIRSDIYHVTCESIEQALRLSSDFLICNYEIISIRKI